MDVFAVTPGEASSTGLDLPSLCTSNERWVRFFSYGNTVSNIGVKTLRLICNEAYQSYCPSKRQHEALSEDSTGLIHLSMATWDVFSKS